MDKILKELESESIYIIREVIATGHNPVLLYSMGKDSSVLLHLLKKAFYPDRIKIPLLHVDTTWKFSEMYLHRKTFEESNNYQCIIYTNQDGLRNEITPFSATSDHYTDVMKTVALKQVIDKYSFDLIICGARRDEEKSRAKERIFSYRKKGHIWDPAAQRPEIWDLYNTHIRAGENIRVFPLSNWTELDIWHYIHQENINIVPLYFAKEREVVNRNGSWIMVNDNRFIFNQGEKSEIRKVRFRTLGCYPLTAAIESSASNVLEIIKELQTLHSSERDGRLIDSDIPYSMQKKKQEGYF